MARKTIIAIGIPGSGKSTYAAKLSKRDPDTCIVNPDGIRGELYQYGKPGVKFDPGKEEETWRIAKERVDDCIVGEKTIFIDATNPDRFGRAKIIDWFEGTGYVIHAARFVMEPGLAILRNDNRGKQDVPAVVICQ